MSNERLYVDFHVVQTVPPSCVNRDDTGRPKTAFYGGANRARVSSQSWKHAMRLMFNELFTSEELGYRTMHAVDLIANEIKKLDSSFDDETAVKEAIKAMNSAGVKINEKKDNKTGALFFISAVQANNLAQLVINGEKDAKLYKQALKETPSVDIAFFASSARVSSSSELPYPVIVTSLFSPHSGKTSRLITAAILSIGNNGCST